VPEPDQHDPIDISGLTFANLRDRTDTVIVRSVRQLLEELDEPQDVVAGFQSSI
jgi:FXSXX-COOH protein